MENGFSVGMDGPDGHGERVPVQEEKEQQR